MFVKTASLFSLMGAGALALPAVFQTDVYVQSVAVATKTEYVTYGATPTPTPTATPQAQVKVVQAPAPAPVEVPAPSPGLLDTIVSNLPIPSVPAVSPPSSDNSGPSYMALVNQYRTGMGLSKLSFSQSLQDGITKTLQASPGVMQHQFFDHATGQVLAPGPAGNFFQAFVQGWMCEVPQSFFSKFCGLGQYNDAGQTGHFDIITNPANTECGCAFSDGIWGCDFA